MFFGDQHGEEFLLAHEIPHFLRQVFQLESDLPVVEHFAKLFSLVVEIRLLICCELGVLHVHQLGPVWLATEHFGFPPGVASLEGVLFRRAHGWQGLAEGLENWRCQHTTAQAWHVENYGDRQVNCGKHNETQLTQATQSIEAQSGCANGSGEGQQVCTAVDEADQHNC